MDVVDSELVRIRVEQLINENKSTYDREISTGQADIDQLRKEASGLDSQIKDINNLVKVNSLSINP